MSTQPSQLPAPAESTKTQKARRDIPDKTKIAAVTDWRRGMPHGKVLAKYEISSGQLAAWGKQFPRKPGGGRGNGFDPKIKRRVLTDLIKGGIPKVVAAKHSVPLKTVYNWWYEARKKEGGNVKPNNHALVPVQAHVTRIEPTEMLTQINVSEAFVGLQKAKKVLLQQHRAGLIDDFSEFELRGMLFLKQTIGDTRLSGKK